MEKIKRWHIGLIVIAVLLTIYNILPTVFYYSKPLKETVNEKMAGKIGTNAVNRFRGLTQESVEWLGSFCDLLSVKPKSIDFPEDDFATIRVQFAKEDDAEKFRQHLPRAGALIPFAPAQLSLTPSQESSAIVYVQRAAPLTLTDRDSKELFKFTEKWDESHNPTPFYRELVNERMLGVLSSITGATEEARLLQAIMHGAEQKEEFITLLAERIIAIDSAFPHNQKEKNQFFKAFTQGPFSSHNQAAQTLLDESNKLLDKVRMEKIDIEQKAKELAKQGGFLESEEEQQLDFLATRETKLSHATRILKANLPVFAAGADPMTQSELRKAVAEESVNLSKYSPIVDRLTLDWNNETLSLSLKENLLTAKNQIEEKSGKGDEVEQLIYNDIARISRESGENITPLTGKFDVRLNNLQDSKSLLAMDLSKIAKRHAELTKNQISIRWNPQNKDLIRANFPVYDWDTYKNLPESEKKLCLVTYAPSATDEEPMPGFRKGSVYVIAKGVGEIVNKFQENSTSPLAKDFLADFSKLSELLKQNGYFGYSANTFPFDKKFAKDFIFETQEAFNTIIAGTREDFKTYGLSRYAVLEFTNVEQRILAENKIDNQIHEDLLKWKDEYGAAQVDPTGHKKFDVPKPTKSPLWSNLALSAKKYVRGDERKILHWGLDLSGGKTVQIELRNANGRVVSDEASIKQGINELYGRVNKMGVSEVSIRQEGNLITLDFPGAQNFSAGELVKASSMFFHIVNEQFSQRNATIGDSVNKFLQDVWNEAVVTGKKDAASINLIAWKHLYGEGASDSSIKHRSSAARTLYESGLRLAHPQDDIMTSQFNDASSKIAVYRGTNFSEWNGQTHPLLFVFNNYALEGANLQNVRSGYDPSKGNYLSFEVKSSHAQKDGQKINPRSEFGTWTSAFAKDKILGTPLEQQSQGHGWRMSVILNGTVISAPTLESALKEGGMISGSFTAREINKLEADLQAGSLSFAPHILSEKNVSPELGIKDRTKSIFATAIAIAFVFALMTGYYRFAGLVASIAVIFNLLIMWAALQNIQATLTLASIAALILNVGMAVDANVLVFERIREEFKKTGRISGALSAGYKKAFTAILDSNVTTIIAAIILLQFDSGPIKGFAVTLIIGIVSSMFTALFMTRTFFAYWIKNPKNKELKMAELIKSAKFNFLKYGRYALSGAAVVVIAGAFVFSQQKDHILGMDFSGGYALTLTVEPKADTNYREVVENALAKAGASSQDIQVRELSPSNHIRIFLGKTMELKGKPFEGLALERFDDGKTYRYENNPRIEWIVKALESEGLTLSKDTKLQLEQGWTSVSGQMSDSMRNSALIGLGLALLCIFFYITVRFEFKYAVSATLALFHDVLVTLAIATILNWLHVPVQIDLNTIAALMTIVGYSLNDTIIIFDRVREDLKANRNRSFREIVNIALNTTLSRTVMTSATTFVVLLALVMFGGGSIFGFSLVMSLGVIIGTFSSLFVAAPLLLFFHKREEAKELSVSSTSR